MPNCLLLLDTNLGLCYLLDPIKWFGRMQSQAATHVHQPENTLDICNDVLCLLYRSKQESRGHLFFECLAANIIWKVIMAFNLLRNPEVEWENMVNWAVNNWKLNSLKAV
jgi:hypothetical protein